MSLFPRWGQSKVAGCGGHLGGCQGLACLSLKAQDWLGWSHHHSSSFPCIYNVHIYVCVCIYIDIHTRIYIHTHTNTHTQVFHLWKSAEFTLCCFPDMHNLSSSLLIQWSLLSPSEWETDLTEQSSRYSCPDVHPLLFLVWCLISGGSNMVLSYLHIVFTPSHCIESKKVYFIHDILPIFFFWGGLGRNYGFHLEHKESYLRKKT